MQNSGSALLQVITAFFAAVNVKCKFV